MEAMNGALVSIAVQDTLDIRKYSKYSKPLSAVWISHDAAFGSVVFGGTFKKLDTTMTFAIPGEANVAVFNPVSQQLSVTALPSAICESIVTHAMHFPEGVIVSSAADCSSAISPNLFRVAHHLRSDAMDSYFSTNHFVFKISVPVRHITTPELTVLRGWQRSCLRCPHPSMYTGDHRGTRWGTNSD
jgi:hypothetical protein